jgi:hypothetical protein
MSGQQVKENESTGPWSEIIVGIVIFAVAFGLNEYLANMEEHGGSIRIHWIIALAYNIGGRWGAIGLLAVVAIGWIMHGTNRLLNGPAAPKPAEPGVLATPPGAQLSGSVTSDEMARFLAATGSRTNDREAPRPAAVPRPSVALRPATPLTSTTTPTAQPAGGVAPDEMARFLAATGSRKSGYLVPKPAATPAPPPGAPVRLTGELTPEEIARFLPPPNRPAGR